jgi:O-antigen/teichoic acid export membrane protein
MKRELRFKELSIIRIIANCAEFAGKVGFAAAGYHVWCFILGGLCRVVVTGIGVQLRHPWRPKWVLKVREAKSYATFGLKTSASQILFFFYTNVDYQVVNYYFGATANGLYRAAYELVLEPVRIISAVVVEVAFPLFSRLRTKRAALIEQFIAFTRQNLVVVIPFIALVLLASEEMIGFFIGSDWTGAAQAARILCIVGVFRALSFVVPPLLDGIGYPATTLIYTSVAAVVLPCLYIAFAAVLGPRLGYVSVAWAWACGYPIAFAVLAWLAMYRIGLGALAYLKRVMGIPACTIVAMGAGWAARWLASPLRPTPRLGVIAVVTLSTLGVLLAYFQGISPRSIRAALSSEGPPPEEANPPVA